jgi:hypothetical protein
LPIGTKPRTEEAGLLHPSRMHGRQLPMSDN